MDRTLARLSNLAIVGMAIMVAILLSLILRRELVGGGGTTTVETTRPPARPDSVLVENWTRFLAGGHQRGPATAPVTILEFGDYECPFCARFARAMVEIEAAYPGQVRFVYRHWPLSMHRFAYPAARAAECAGAQGRFWEMHELLYAKRDSLGLVTFDELATRAGVTDAKRFHACAASGKAVPNIDAGMHDARQAGGTGTPTLIVNGVLKLGRVDTAYVGSLLRKAGIKQHAGQR